MPAFDPGQIAVRLARLLPPETAHRVALRALSAGLVHVPRPAPDPILAMRLWDRDFPNPIGIAAGFDKHGEVIGPTLDLGAGFVEIGGVTPLPQPGNPMPRLFRLTEDEAVINRFGFNSVGIDVVRGRLAAFRVQDPRRAAIVGVNLARNKDTADPAADFVAGVRAFAPLADFLTINVSSPNTPGLRAMQNRGEMATLLRRVAEAMPDSGPGPVLLVKVAPDLDTAGCADVAEVVLTARRPDGRRLVDGLVVGNTTLGRSGSLRSRWRNEAGGLSGRPLFAPSTRVLAEFHRLTAGALPLVGVGGVFSGEDAYAKIRAGASLVQLYSALVYRGPGLIARICRDLATLLRADGFGSVADAVGAGSLTNR